jgi:hypothetical protein
MPPLESGLWWALWALGSIDLHHRTPFFGCLLRLFFISDRFETHISETENKNHIF